jgi:hypothetical protein
MTDDLAPLDPYPFQEADVANALQHEATGFVVAETGAGKTLIATEIGLSLDVQTRLVIAPAGTHKTVWARTIERQDPGAVVRRIDGSPKGKDAMNALEWGEPGWYTITPQLFTLMGTEKKNEHGKVTRAKVWPDTLKVDLAIADEAHLLGGGGAATDALRRLKAGHRLAMSGTLVRNKVENFWPLLRWCYPHLNGPGQLADVNRERWITEYMATKYDRFAPTNRGRCGSSRRSSSPPSSAASSSAWRTRMWRGSRT